MEMHLETCVKYGCISAKKGTSVTQPPQRVQNDSHMTLTSYRVPIMGMGVTKLSGLQMVGAQCARFQMVLAIT